MNKAKFIGACKKNPYDRHAWEHTDLVYEYKGQTYIVTKHNNGYSGTDASLKYQHDKAQAEIDERLSKKQEQEPWQYEGSAQEAFDKFFEEMGW